MREIRTSGWTRGRRPSQSQTVGPYSTHAGIIHQEMPKGDATGAMHGFQLWANLPAASKMTPPRYRGITAAEIPAVNDPGGATVKIIAGMVDGLTGPVRDVVTRPEYLDVSIPK